MFGKENMGKKKTKGVIWVSAILYVALGIIAITLILSAGLPLINKIRDKNVVAQTKGLMFSIDENIRTVVSEGPGSRRYLSPIVVKKGQLIIDGVTADNDNLMEWSMKTTNKLMEPGVKFQEGTMSIKMEPTPIENEYTIRLILNFTNIADIQVKSKYENPFSGSYSMLIKHTGTYEEENKDTPIIELEIN